MKFKKLIQKYSNSYTFKVLQEGSFNGPNWEEGNNNEYEITCAVFPMSSEDVARYDGLGYTTKDIKVFVPAHILIDENTNEEKVVVDAYNKATETEEEIVLDNNTKMIYKNNNFELDKIMDRTTQADFIKWFAKRSDK